MRSFFPREFCSRHFSIRRPTTPPTTAAIGAVIGHEMTHGFDDEGRKFDAQGNLRDWWTPEDEKNFNERAACVEKQFDSYVVQDDMHENGKLVLGESIADLGGLNLAYRALQKAEKGKKARDRSADLLPTSDFFLPLRKSGRPMTGRNSSA